MELIKLNVPGIGVTLDRVSVLAIRVCRLMQSLDTPMDLRYDFQI